MLKTVALLVFKIYDGICPFLLPKSTYSNQEVHYKETDL